MAERSAGVPLKSLPPDTLPDEGLGAAEALSSFRSKYEAQLSGSAGPRYLGFVTGGSTPAALAGDWLVSAYDQNVGYDGDSVATTVERETLALLRTLFSLSNDFAEFSGGVVRTNGRDSLVAIPDVPICYRP